MCHFSQENLSKIFLIALALCGLSLADQPTQAAKSALTATNAARGSLSLKNENAFTWPESWDLEVHHYIKFKSYHLLPKSTPNPIEVLIRETKVPHLANLTLVQQTWRQNITELQQQKYQIIRSGCQELERGKFYCEAVGKDAEDTAIGFKFWWLNRSSLISMHLKHKNGLHPLGQAMEQAFLKNLKTRSQATKVKVTAKGSGMSITAKSEGGK